MDKQKILKTLLLQLESNLEVLVRSAFESKEAATGDESKAENKYDTRGLEASYLAGAQAKRSEDLKADIYKLKNLKVIDFTEWRSVASTAIVCTLINGENKKYFFILPIAGGVKLSLGEIDLNVITPDSLVGSSLIGKRVGDEFEVKLKDKNFEYEVLSIE